MHSVTRVNSLLLTVNLSIAPDATTGARSVTVDQPGWRAFDGARRVHHQCRARHHLAEPDLPRAGREQ